MLTHENLDGSHGDGAVEVEVFADVALLLDDDDTEDSRLRETGRGKYEESQANGVRKQVQINTSGDTWPDELETCQSYDDFLLHTMILCSVHLLARLRGPVLQERGNSSTAEDTEIRV